MSRCSIYGMEVKQTNSNNHGIPNNGNAPSGYRHEDGLHLEERYHKTYQKMAIAIADHFTEAKTVLELGCGAGSLANHLRTYKPELLVVTADGNQEVPGRSPFIDKEHHFVIRTDEDYHFVNENGETVQFDLIVCFEHLEHLNQLEKFMENLNRHAHSKTYFYGTAANWGYKHHPTVKTDKQWEEYFLGKGWEPVRQSLLTLETKPFNFDLERTNELMFRKTVPLGT